MIPLYFFWDLMNPGDLKLHSDRQDPVAIPPVQYQSTLQRLWCRKYNPHLKHPDKDIMIYKDKLVSALRRLCYQPDVAAAYDFVLGAYLVIPVGMVFGFRDIPYLLCLLYELISFT